MSWLQKLLAYLWEMHNRPPVKPPVKPPLPPVDPTEAARRMLELHNAKRAREVLKPLALDPRLMAAAQEQSDCQARRNKIGHDGCDGSQFFERLARRGYQAQASSENVASGPAPYQADWALDDWMHSAGHRANVMGDWQHAGFAVAKSAEGQEFWTAVYARAR